MKLSTHKKIYFILLISAYCPTTAHEITLKEIFTTRQATDQVIEKLNRSCDRRNMALHFERQKETRELIATIEVLGERLPVPRSLLESVYYSLVKEHPYKDDIAVVRPTDKTPGLEFELNSEEISILKKRSQFCQKNIETLLDIQLTDKTTPRIALCCSGGGYRAMFSTAGLLAGLFDTGILDTIDYIASLSGSTWAISSWMLSDEPFNLFFGPFMDRARAGISPKNAQSFIHNIRHYLPILAQEFIRKLIFKEIPSVIDVYGFCLGMSLLDDAHKRDYLNTGLINQLPIIKDGKKPFPIYTALIPHDEIDSYSWMEFSPIEVACSDFNGAVQSWGFGREFDDGISITSAPPLSLGNLMGLWGSAISASFKEIYDMLLDELEPKALFAPLKKVAEETVIGDIRIFAALLKNFNYKKENAPYNQQELCKVVDAGIDINIPLIPLLQQARKVDIIIVCDASANVLGAPELRKAENHARKNNIPFPVINYTGITDKIFSVFDDGPNSNAPIIIYIPMVKNENYHATFDPQNHLSSKGFLNTFNFVYSEHERLTLAGLFSHAAHAANKSILEVIKTVAERKS
jgi:phospholipase A2